MSWSIRKLFQTRQATRHHRRGRRSRLETLERRALMAGDFGLDPAAMSLSFTSDLDTTTSAIQKDPDADPPPSSGPTVPLYNSNPGAPKTVYLDFDGHFEAVDIKQVSPTFYWDTFFMSTPVFTFDNDRSTFSAQDRSGIEETWQRVAEDYAPFNVNVTTDIEQYQANGGLRVAIGGRWTDWFDDWQTKVAGVDTPASAGGVKLGRVSGTVWVFSDGFQADAKHIADAVSHESGHGFGLQHHSLFDANGNKQQEYHPGTPLKGPIMGISYPSPNMISYEVERSTWWYGRRSDGEIQDDLAKLDQKLGYRADDHAGSFAAATPLSVAPLIVSAPYLQTDGFAKSLSGGGIIERMSDVDAFSFTAEQRSEVNIEVNVADVGANLDMWFELKSSRGLTVASANPESATGGATISTTLGAGNYYLVVRSDGDYGEVGQYSIQGTIAPQAPIFLESGHVYVTATLDDDQARVHLDSDGQIIASLQRRDAGGNLLASWQRQFDPDEVADIIFHGYAGDDHFVNDTALSSVAYGDEGGDELVGGAGSDRFFGGDGADTLKGLQGNDNLDGGSGADFLYGGLGNDTLHGNAGSDYLHGEQGHDRLEGDSPAWPDMGGDDYLYGGDGDDVLKGLGGDDTLRGGDGHDLLFGGAGNDELYGERHGDELYGEDGNDRIDGGSHDDLLLGDAGNDKLFGSHGADTLYGGVGNDLLDGGYDGYRDLLWGGTGDDSFVQHYRLVYSYNYFTRRSELRWVAEDRLQDFHGWYDDITRTYHGLTSVRL